ncbi:MAG: bifunctional phosphoribosyl-AMP cyclohydrolase/phosphoribosyl-ATP diphosphatase HisIE [Prevotellaceae bacterium]|jgi:phosphoribosyl-ATP pyrophosphohydrolase/phosphoribosyl-AMP cyclohydrolase|nr:bifunctional phosphoribosyl-AMP cyclohydrolase/phosphoribosyl-ATP diphosphatase HisIE [Prevotellaceae bacterium]
MIDKLNFDENGLIPAIVQDHYTKAVLTLAYMNAESLAISIAEKKTCFYSRSRKELWRKGETSGNWQHIASIYADCDGDALVVEVVKDGPACHTGEESCFYTPVFVSDEIRRFSLNALFDLLVERRETRPEGSYTSYLFEQGLDKILKKVGEETTEVIIGAKNSDKEMVYEIADLIYHLMVLMVNQNVKLSDIIDELASRHIINKKEKQKNYEEKE